jgi:GrpB-like predicted nucleotidyltransferase (UPF0157 family)
MGHHATREYDPVWVARAEALIDRLHAALAPVATSIEHIGSTAVPGMGARPIIDVQVSVVDIFDRQSFEPGLSSLGYQHFPFPELPVMDYLVYVPSDGGNTEHVAICEVGSWHERRHLALREYLRNHPEAAGQYELVKRRAAQAAEGSRKRYAAGKDRTVKLLEARALAWFERQRDVISRGYG